MGSMTLMLAAELLPHRTADVIAYSRPKANYIAVCSSVQNLIEQHHGLPLPLNM